MKSFIIIGLSTFSSYLAKSLSERNFDVIGIDNDEERVEKVKPYLTRGIIGDAKDKELLKKIGVKEADAVIVSLGQKVDDSLLIIYHLKELEIENLYVNVTSEDHARIINLIEDAEIIFPELESASRLAQRIDNPNVLDYIPLGEDYSIIDWTPSRSFVGKTLGTLDLKNKYHVQVVSIEDSSSDRIKLIPRADHVIKESDILVVIGSNEDLEELKSISDD